jgi:hypothetical protein
MQHQPLKKFHKPCLCSRNDGVMLTALVVCLLLLLLLLLLVGAWCVSPAMDDALISTPLPIVATSSKHMTAVA